MNDTNPAEQSPAHLVADRRVRVVLIGAGAMGQAWARALSRHDRCELVAIVDSDPRRAKGLALLLRNPRLSVAESLDALPDLAADACVNVTPPADHYRVIEQALDAGLSVLTEKPFTTDLDGAVALTRQAKRLGRVLTVSQSRSHAPGMAAFREAIAQLGGLRTLEARFSRGHPAEGFRAELDQPLLSDMAVHSFDAARMLSGADAVSVYCDTTWRPGTGYRGAVEAAALFEMADGSRFHYSGTWSAPALPTSWSGSWRATGPAGTAVWDGAGTVRLALVPPAGTAPDGGQDTDACAPVVVEVDDAGFDRDPLRQVAVPLDGFVDALTTGSAPWGVAAGNLGTIAMLDAALVSARDRRRLPVRDPSGTGRPDADAAAARGLAADGGVSR